MPERDERIQKAKYAVLKELQRNCVSSTCMMRWNELMEAIARRERIEAAARDSLTRIATLLHGPLDDDIRAVLTVVRGRLRAALAAPEQDLQDEVNAWQREAFPDATEIGIIAHLRKEVNEEIVSGCDVDEYADAAMLLMGLCERHGVRLDDLVRAKLKVNKARAWPKKPNAQGFYEHEPEQAEPAPKPESMFPAMKPTDAPKPEQHREKENPND